MKILMSWSSGKDSAWALHVLRRDGLAVAGLLTSINATADRVSMHGVRTEILRAQAAAAALPLTIIPLPWPCTNAVYEARMRAAVDGAVADGFTHVAFGDLFLEDVRRYREERLAPLGMQPIFPLWGRDTRELARVFIDDGFRAVVVCVDTTLLDASFSGREYDASFLAELPAGVNPCGENGEFHTFVYDGPLFRERVELSIGETVIRDGRFAYTDLV